MSSFIVFVISVLAPILMLGPLVSRLATRAAFKRPAPADVEDRPNFVITRSYTPLEFAPDPMVWPSKQPQAASIVRDLPWPSEIYGRIDDDSLRKPLPPAPEAPPRPEPKPAKQQPAAKPAPKIEPKAEPLKVEQPASKPVKPAPPPSATAAFIGEVPSDEEIVDLVAELGVVKAVDQLMRRTGWDVNRAAKHVRRVITGN